MTHQYISPPTAAMASDPAPVRRPASGIDAPPPAEAGAGRPPAGSGRRRRPGPVAALLRRPGLVLSVLWLAVLFVAVVAPGLIAPGDPLATEPSIRLRPPSFEHLFGTDQLGRDTFTRTVHGARRTLPAALLATGIGLVAGSVLGLLAGYLQTWVDLVVMRIADVLLSIPGLLLALMLIAVLGRGSVVNVAIAIGVGAIASTARVMRAEVLRVRGSLYVEAARSGGGRWPRVLLRHVLPNAMGPVWAMTVLLFGVAILGVTTLSFLGFGVQPPTPEWGSLVSSGRDALGEAWWLSILPAGVVAVTVLAANRLSRAFNGEWTAS